MTWLWICSVWNWLTYLNSRCWEERFDFGIFVDGDFIDVWFALKDAQDVLVNLKAFQHSRFTVKLRQYPILVTISKYLLKVHHIRSSLYQNYVFESRQKILTGRLGTSRIPCGRLAWGKVLSQSTEDVCSPDPWRVKPSSFRWWGSGGRLERVQSSTLYHHPSHKGCHRHPYLLTGLPKSWTKNEN